MAGETLYGLNEADRDAVEEDLLRGRGGKGAPSHRPTPTRRRNLLIGSERTTFIARIATTIPARSDGSTTFGQGTADFGVLDDSGVWTLVASTIDVYNRTESEVRVPGDDTYVYEVAEKVGNKWVLISNVQVQTITGYNESQDQSLGLDNGGSPEWQEDAECT